MRAKIRPLSYKSSEGISHPVNLYLTPEKMETKGIYLNSRKKIIYLKTSISSDITLYFLPFLPPFLAIAAVLLANLSAGTFLPAALALAASLAFIMVAKVNSACFFSTAA